jgi:hypothetical protein
MAPLLEYGLLVAAVAAFLATIGRLPAVVTTPVQPPAWDIPVRVVVATLLVIVISALAPVIGGRASGILATFPVYAAVLATFAHLARGPGEASAVLRGLATGLLGFGAFFLALGWLLGITEIALGFAGALAFGFVVQAATLPLVRRSGAPAPAAEPSGLE